MTTSPTTRRSFLHRTSLAAASAAAWPAVLRAQATRSPNERLNLAYVGVGGRGRNAVLELQDENLVAFCDVDDARAAVTYRAFPNVPRFRDYRVMLDKLGREIDAVRISTPDHMHFPIAMAALALGKHVFVEKPLTHTVAEARTLARVAREKKVATQMGNQGHANEGMRLLKEWFRAGVLGEVREVRCWTNRYSWPQGGPSLPDHSQGAPPTPATLDWDRWLGVAPARAYDPAFLPGRWRGYWAYGNGALGDMACHILDGAYWALELGAPQWVEAVSAKGTDYAAPLTEIVLLGNIAIRTGRRVNWDAAAMRITNHPEADRLLTKTYRAGFGV